MAPAFIDHIIFLLPTPLFDTLPSWLSTNFTVLEGGSHSGCPSRNKLIILADGSYIELFNWTGTPPSLDPSNPPMRVWGPKKPGLVDFCLGTKEGGAGECAGDVNARLEEGEGNEGLGVRYGEPMRGGRKRADGVLVEWEVTRPEFIEGEKTPKEELFPGGRLDVPFFCHDLTERRLRVPVDDESKTRHPCGARGVKRVEVLVPGNRVEEYAELYRKIVGADSVDGRGIKEKVVGVSVQSGLGSGAEIVIRSPRNESEHDAMRERGVGIFSILVHRDDSAAQEELALGTDEIASRIAVT